MRIGKLCAGVLLLTAALMGCNKTPSGTTTRTANSGPAHMPETYVTADTPICLVKIVTSETNAATRQGDMLNLLSKLYNNSKGWAERYSALGVDYIDFKSLTLQLYAGCDDKGAVAAAVSDVVGFSGKFSDGGSGNPALVAPAKVLDTYHGGVARFAYFNPGAKVESCLMHFTLVRKAQDSNGVIPNAVLSAAVEFHFPLADAVVINEHLFFLLARDCDKQDQLFAGMSVGLERWDLKVGRDLVRDADPHLADYKSAQPKT